MTYDYFVSDIDSATVTAPNSLLYPLTGKAQNGTPWPHPWSTKDTLDAMLQAGATPSKMVLGLAYYGHTWFVPGINDDSWAQFGVKA